jgi:hypothetical protein
MTAEYGMMVGLGLAPRPAARVYKITAAKGEATLAKRAKNIALFFAAPFIGLAYLLAFPFVGLALLLWFAGKAVMANKKARHVALAIAAPFIALACVTVGPIVGLGALAWMGGKAALGG